jgi:hypothetical protein
MQDEEILAMAEKMVDAMDRGLLMDTPFLRRIRRESYEEGREEGREEFARQSVLDVITVRFDPPASNYRPLEARLAQVKDPARLRQLLQIAAQATDLADFEQALESQSSPPQDLNQ